MHTERFEVPAASLTTLREHRRRVREGDPGRLLAVGTTTVRTLESLPELLPEAGVVQGDTDLLIAPPFRMRWVDALLTNFHLPRSTLLALVAAMVGLEPLRALYREAIEQEYRFYSYGDAMLILP
jgi:S-adenosylmethionine:tRNA ribosyltransferase-isomerase